MYFRLSAPSTSLYNQLPFNRHFSPISPPFSHPNHYNYSTQYIVSLTWQTVSPNHKKKFLQTQIKNHKWTTNGNCKWNSEIYYNNNNNNNEQKLKAKQKQQEITEIAHFEDIKQCKRQRHIKTFRIPTTTNCHLLLITTAGGGDDFFS